MRLRGCPVGAIGWLIGRSIGRILEIRLWSPRVALLDLLASSDMLLGMGLFIDWDGHVRGIPITKLSLPRYGRATAGVCQAGLSGPRQIAAPLVVGSFAVAAISVSEAL